jgi:cation:H+ antiporter
MGISDLVIGLTLIAFGTSAPEIFVGISSIINQNEEIALGTAIGSNISNIALIFGVSCLYLTGPSKTQLWNFVPFGLSVILLGLTLVDGKISFNESMGFVGILMIFMFVLFKTDGLTEEDSIDSSEFGHSLFVSLIGLVALIAGANIAVIYAENTALLLGVPQLIIGLTIIALGTSLPELAATIVALRKGKHQMVVGNIIGSNVFNLVFIIPMIGFFGSVELSPMVMQRDFYILLALSIVFILLAVVLTKFQFRKNIFLISGVVLIASYTLYISALSGII